MFAHQRQEANLRLSAAYRDAVGLPGEAVEAPETDRAIGIYRACEVQTAKMNFTPSSRNRWVVLKRNLSWFGYDYKPFGSSGEGGENEGADVTFHGSSPFG
jgi:hypothetical protein